MGARAVIMLPLRPGRRWVGMIGFSWAEPQDFTERDARIYQALLDQAAVTLDSRRLLAESTERAEEMRFLFNVTQTATSSTADLESSLHGVAGVLREFLDDAHADVFIPDDAEDALRLAACSHLSHKSGALYPRGAASSISWAAEALEPVIIEDAAGDAGQRFDDIAPETRTAIAIPIAAGGQLSGVIRLQSTRANAFDAHTVQLLLTLGGALHAIIQNQRLLQEVTAANERLLELDKLKSMFLANMSHELRTPLNSIIGFSRVMLKGIDGPLTELQQQDLETIHSSGQHLLGLINDILDQSKIEANKMELSSEYFDIGEVIKGVMSTAVALVKEKPVELIQQLPADLPQVWGDEFRTRQVLLNLVSNAAKFTEEGSITVAVDQMTAESGVEVLRIAIKDTGIGIDPKDMSKLFAAFQQVDASMTRRVGGTGLGLQIAKSLIEMQGGEIWVESEVGVGSVFAFSIPLHPPPAQEEEAEEATTATEPTPSLALDSAPEAPAEPLAPEAPTPPPRKVLVLDDEAGVINLYRRYLIDRGYAIVGTTDPDALEAMIAEHAPDIILLDVMMPNRDGWEVLRSLKRNPRNPRHPGGGVHHRR
ncbi:MAG: ATP-binding protein [Anaerolineae bacterium]|nr:ATP-binding protein [Anaerolineae bacterium]